jgi:3'-phosphoadenosine 5'-phosphosulfate sulfotransferase (PAPS reductase)/FAD synthetase
MLVSFMSDKQVRHILSLSGGKDSTALAIYMRDRVPNMEYIFHDTGKEMPDTLDYIERLESYLGTRVIRTTTRESFDDILRSKGGMLPSGRRRWCTDYLKLKPFEAYIGEEPCINYVGIRADEDRVGYISHKPNIEAVFPFRDDGIDYAGVVRILDEAGLGMPPYTQWGRTRSGCFFCFYQQKIEWVRLKQHFPHLFEEAKAYEKPNRVNGQVFHWTDEPLTDLEQPERMAAIEASWEKMQERKRARQPNKPLVHTLGGLELDDSPRDGCMICQL